MPDIRTGTVPLVVFMLAFASAAGLVIELRFLEIPKDRPGGTGHNGTGNGTGQSNPMEETGGGGAESGTADNIAPIVTPGAGGGGGGAGKNDSKTQNQTQFGLPQDTPPTAGGAAVAGDPENVAPDPSKPATWGGAGGAGKRAPPGGGGNGNNNGTGTSIELPEWALWLLGILIGAVVLAAGAYYIRNYLKRARTSKRRAAAKAIPKKGVRAEDETFFEELSDILDESFASIEGAGDVRTAIVRCYARMVGALAIRGILRMQSTTPREFYRKWSATIGFSSKSMKGLTLLFEEAVYSEHPMGEVHREKALTLLKEGLGEVKQWQDSQKKEEAIEVVKEWKARPAAQ